MFHLTVKKRKFHHGLLLMALLLMANINHAAQKILFGSCADEETKIPIFDAINKENADLFIFLGDNIYADTTNMLTMKEKYQRLADNPGFARLRKTTAVMAIWDDHDYGANDAGKEYPKKAESRTLFLDFWKEPQDSTRRKQRNGVYTAYMIGKGRERVHVILPDLRWNRTALKTVSRAEYERIRKPANMGPYKISKDKNSTMLGAQQWRWLEQELQKPAALTIIASSLQLLPHFSGWESWSNFPQDRQRLIALIKKQQINGVIIISGDTHWGELTKFDKNVDYPLWELTSSGLTKEWKKVSPNEFRVGKPYASVNYGEIKIAWEQSDPKISLLLKNISGKTIIHQDILLSAISPYKSSH